MVKTYEFRVVVEPDEDQWIAYCPALVKQGAVTGGETRDEAFQNIQEALGMVIESLIDLGIPIPEDDHDGAVAPEERLVVAV